MSDGTTGETPESAAAPEVEAPAADPKETGLSLFSSGDPEGDGEAETVETPPAVEDDTEEIDHEGEKFKVHKKLKDAFLRQADYTRKTQEVAEARRSVEQQYAQYQQTAQLQQQHIAEIAKVYSINDRLQQFAALDWDALTNADPVQAQKLERQMRNLQTEKQGLEQGIAQKQQHMTFTSQQETAKRIEDGRRELQKHIKDHGSPEFRKRVLDTAASIGYQPEEVAGVSDPRAMILLNRLALAEEQVRKLTVQAKPKPEPAPKPVTRIGGAASSNTKPLSEVSVDEFARRRREYIAKNR